ncbi:PPOX class F420-dependent oxidoreductase [Oceanicoccus sp. KOV_DT_Chl]|uniref:PPOX class F420-dependent oxidoreductase n=1 Tax=Oceanicoccus sp. KOV_DT_Chl TaxID=1904639 RepID=UPI000C7B31EC|nr:PPOX class F420-dependent oxidoreductase [Oceanicoccus sp. KOV_DT_Chl]
MKPIDNASYILFGTQKKDGTMVDTPVWFASDQTHYYVFSAANAGKVKRLRNFSNARIAPCNVTGKPLGSNCNTQAELITLPEEITHAHQQLTIKYGWQMRGLDWLSKLSGKYNKRAFIKIIKPSKQLP